MEKEQAELMTTLKQVDEYVAGALQFPIDGEQLVAIVMLHFPDLIIEQARLMTAAALLASTGRKALER